MYTKQLRILKRPTFYLRNLKCERQIQSTLPRQNDILPRGEAESTSLQYLAAGSRYTIGHFCPVRPQRKILQSEGQRQSPKITRSDSHNSSILYS